MKKILSLFNNYPELKNIGNKPRLLTILELFADELKSLNTIKCSYCKANACMYVHYNNDKSRQIRKKKYSCIKHQSVLHNLNH
jgi:hypothetical protein